VRRLAFILFLASLSLARGQGYVTNAPIILLTNASNSASTWFNDGGDTADFVQDMAVRQPTNAGTYYAFGVSNVMTNASVAASETNIIALSAWCRNFSPGESPGSMPFGTWDGSGGAGGLMMMYDSGNVYLGTRVPDNFFYTALGDTASFHHLFLSYDHTRTNELIAYVDGVKLTSHAGTYQVSRGLAATPTFAVGNSTDLGVFRGYAKIYVSHAMVFTNYTAQSMDWLASNIYANGRNYYDPPAAPPPSGDPSMNRQAAALWWRTIGK